MPESDSVLLRMIDEQAPPIRDPFVFKGGLTIGKSFFEGVIVYYATPLMLSGFYLRSEYSTLRGHSFGPSCDELITLIEGLQVLNA